MAKQFTLEDIVVSDDAPQIQYVQRDKSEHTNIHYGQLKLLLSEILFLILYVDPKIENLIMVYVGAAPGEHIPYLSKLFPKLSFHLFDKSDYNIRGDCEYHQSFTPELFLEISKGDRKIHAINGYFDDKTADYYKTIRDRVILCSDIRRNVTGDKDQDVADENTIKEDMAMQQKWVISIDPVASMLKFRLPYHNPSETVSQRTQYLAGKIFFGIYPPSESTEMRLVPIKDGNGKYVLTHYDNRKYESIAAYHNRNVRNNDKLYVKNYNIPGFDGSFDDMAYLTILSKYLESVGIEPNPKHIQNMNDSIVTDITYYRRTKKGSENLQLISIPSLKLRMKYSYGNINISGVLAKLDMKNIDATYPQYYINVMRSDTIKDQLRFGDGEYEIWKSNDHTRQTFINRAFSEDFTTRIVNYDDDMYIYSETRGNVKVPKPLQNFAFTKYYNKLRQQLFTDLLIIHHYIMSKKKVPVSVSYITNSPDYVERLSALIDVIYDKQGVKVSRSDGESRDLTIYDDPRLFTGVQATGSRAMYIYPYTGEEINVPAKYKIIIPVYSNPYNPPLVLYSDGVQSITRERSSSFINKCYDIITSKYNYIYNHIGSVGKPAFFDRCYDCSTALYLLAVYQKLDKISEVRQIANL